MPWLTRWMLKASLFYLVLAWGLELLRTGGGWISPKVASFVVFPTIIHLFLVGWLTQMIFGVAYWLFPKETRERPRGPWILGILTLICLNLGLLFRLLAEPMLRLVPWVGWDVMLVLSGALQFIAGAAFVLNTWRRVKGKP